MVGIVFLVAFCVAALCVISVSAYRAFKVDIDHESKRHMVFKEIDNADFSEDDALKGFTSIDI